MSRASYKFLSLNNTRNLKLVRGLVTVHHKTVLNEEKFTVWWLKLQAGNNVTCSHHCDVAKFIRPACGIGIRLFSTGTIPRNMRFVQFTAATSGPQRLGVQLGNIGDIIDVSAVDSSVPNNLLEFLYGGPSLMEKAKRIVAEGKSVVPLSEVKLLAPITKPDKVACVGRNYKDHCTEQNVPIPEEPVFFSKFASCIVGPSDDILYPAVTTSLDWEVELAIVIGTRGKNIHLSDAMDHVFGYTVAQDITARDWQKKRNGGQWLLGKAMDSSCPLGPAVVTKEAISNPYDLHIQCSVNGVVKQEGNTSELIHRVDQVVSFLSHICTLLPGDLILTGTPRGVGVFRNPPEFLKPGDVLESEVVGIGKLRNTVV